jgi:hypothetical protein
MPLLVESVTEKRSVNNLLRDVIITSFGILTGLTFRELLVSATLFFAPGTQRDGVVFNLFITLIVLLITVVLVITW